MSIINTDINNAIEILLQDDVIGFPTETVYGLAGNIFSEKAIDKIYSIKKRPSFNPLIVHLHSVQQLSAIAKNIPEMAFDLAKYFWPGPLTLILEKQDIISNKITANKNTVAVRIPNHPLALSLLQKIPFPLAAPSANPFKSVSPTAAKHVYHYFKDEIKYILDGGDCENGIESTIIGFKNEIPVLYRHGAVSIESIEKVAGKVSIITNNETNPDAPGMLLKHYSPRTKLIVTDNIFEVIESNHHQKIGLITFYKEIISPSVKHQIILSENKDFEEAARNLYAALHELDKMNLDIIITERFPEENLGRSINDRLIRAAC